MREIKFKCWDKEFNRMSEPFDNFNDAFIEFKKVKVDMIPLSFVQGKTATRERFEWLQFTGLHGKSGKEIYEGDIVKVITNHVADLAPNHPETESIVEVKYENGVLWFGDMTMIYQPLKNARIEVIGNIYENSNLL